jgi:hypothetical protein
MSESKKRKVHSADFKTKVALEAVRGVMDDQQGSAEVRGASNDGSAAEKRVLSNIFNSS